MHYLYLTRDGDYDRAAILQGANANFANNRQRANALPDAFERKIAHQDAWRRAHDEKRHYDSRHHPERFHDVSRETARELSTDGPLP